MTCPYHGWTFDAAGKCVAVLGEGPNSRVPRASGSRVRSYPTRVLKGVVFVWMGDRRAPMEEDVPPQFFDSSSLVQGSATQWKCNWRPAMENIYDAHVFYVHKNALRILLLPSKAILGLSKMGPTRPRPEVINGRGLVYTNDNRPTTQNQGSQRQWREDYGDLGKWPRTHVRVWVSMVMNLVARLMPKHAKPLVTNQEWNGAHLPATFQVDYLSHVFTRMTVPVDRKHSRIFYFHSAWPKSDGPPVVQHRLVPLLPELGDELQLLRPGRQGRRTAGLRVRREPGGERRLPAGTAATDPRGGPGLQHARDGRIGTGTGTGRTATAPRAAGDESAAQVSGD